jgi:Na+/melibiose symporter-like transporter
MWYGLLYIYLDGYLGVGNRIALMLLVATVASTLTTPLWITLIRKTSKATAWVIGLSLFCLQLLCMLFLGQGDPNWMVFALVFIAHLCFTANDVAAVSALGDIVDYGKLKFHVDRGATYFALLALIFKVGLGLGGGLSLGIAGTFGFRAAEMIHTASSIWSLKLGFIVLPACCALLCLLLVARTPINRQRHRIIQRRLESRLMRSAS